MQDVILLKQDGWREMTGFEQDKLHEIQACPTCPEMIQKVGESYDNDRIQYDWRCDKCDTLVMKIYTEEATLCTKWEPNPDPEPRGTANREEKTPRPVLNLQGFQKMKFLRSRACPICPGMLDDFKEQHKPAAVEYTWKCNRCSTQVTQRFEEATTTWSPAASE